jgi:hypothetical protein
MHNIRYVVVPMLSSCGITVVGLLGKKRRVPGACLLYCQNRMPSLARHSWCSPVLRFKCRATSEATLRHSLGNYSELMLKTIEATGSDDATVPSVSARH